MVMTPVVFMGQSKKDIREMAEDVRREFGHSIRDVQMGFTPSNATKMKGNLTEVMEIVTDEDTDTYRAMYTTKLEGRVYVLDAFKKKSKSGKATPQADLDRILLRLKAAKAHYRDHPP